MTALYAVNRTLLMSVTKENRRTYYHIQTMDDHRPVTSGYIDQVFEDTNEAVEACALEAGLFVCEKTII